MDFSSVPSLATVALVALQVNCAQCATANVGGSHLPSVLDAKPQRHEYILRSLPQLAC